jgi:hypothetical protein
MASNKVHIFINSSDDENNSSDDDFHVTDDDIIEDNYYMSFDFDALLEAEMQKVTIRGVL